MGLTKNYPLLHISRRTRQYFRREPALNLFREGACRRTTAQTLFIFLFKYIRLLGWLGHRQISPSPSYLYDMTFQACGASLVFVSCSTMLQTPRACPLRKPRAGCAIGMCFAMQPTFVSFLRFNPGRKKAATSLPPPITSSIVPNVIWALCLHFFKALKALKAAFSSSTVPLSSPSKISSMVGLSSIVVVIVTRICLPATLTILLLIDTKSSG